MLGQCSLHLKCLKRAHLVLRMNHRNLNHSCTHFPPRLHQCQTLLLTWGSCLYLRPTHLNI